MAEPHSRKYPAAAVRISADDVGRRVTVRREVTGGFSDVIGELVSMDSEFIEVRRPAGDSVRLRRHEVAAARVVTPRGKTASGVSCESPA